MSTYQIITVTPLRRGFGANVSGVDLSGALDGPTQAEIRQAWVAHSVLCFPGQTLDPASLERFSAILGPFGHDPYVTAMEGFAHVIEVRREARETTPVFGGAWHSDWSFQATPPSATVLYGVDIPPVGGATVLADAARAYADLSPTMQRLLSSLRGVHSAAPAYGPHGLFARDDDSRSMRISVSPTADSRQPTTSKLIPSCGAIRNPAVWRSMSITSTPSPSKACARTRAKRCSNSCSVT